MPIGISEDHEALRQAARRFLESHCPPSVPRALLDVAPDAPEEFPPFWSDLAKLGWLGLHVPEDHGGSGYGLPELAVVLEELGRAMAPGPFLTPPLAAAVLVAGGTDDQRRRWLPGLADGSVLGAVQLHPGDPVAGAGSG